MRGFNSIFCGILISISITLGGFAQSPSVSDSPNQMDLLNNKRGVSIGDRLVYQVTEEREAGTVIFVNDKGEIDVPLIGAIPAKGKTPKELAYIIKERLEVDFFHRATVLLRFQFADNSRGRISIVGQVARPGPLNVPADEVFTVSDAVIRAGGFLPRADSAKVVLKRPQGDDSEKVQEFVINVLDIFENGNINLDMVVRPDDIIVIPAKEGIDGFYYITGAVNNPGEFGMPKDGSDVTISQAILRAGGFAKFANETEVTLLRESENADSGPENIVINVKEILEKGIREDDILIKSGDIIRVKEVLFAF